ncbi:hypothetical protein FDP41_002911 [Naegleria fowleri]|uniref:Uncharacterized protein n=1 Tax=Naegleria fowleri TaxID=5763 RepID=A0A6A5BT80_NAEFO|nr:uncharacterized protein FDP41_002911 [Naegleria fowleri]KAF0978396.1 hypothetical protein FDP41_002911 [Naegleria fowleri]
MSFLENISEAVKKIIDVSDRAIIIDPTVDRNELESFAGFPCEVSFIHEATKKSSICSLNNDMIDFFFHDSGCSERAPFGGNSKLQKFVACHSILALNNYDVHRNRLDVEKANNEKVSVGRDVENDDGLMNVIFQLGVQDHFPTVWNHRKEYANTYYSLLMNNNFLLQMLENFKPTSGGLIEKSDFLAFLFAKLKVLDLENEYLPKVQAFYEKLWSDYSVGSMWRFAKLEFFDSTRFSQEDFKYAREHDSYLTAVGRFVRQGYRIVDKIQHHDPFKQYYKAPDGGCILL